MAIDTGTYDKRVQIERRDAPSNDPMDSGERAWVPVRKVWANVRDQLPSKSEKLDEGVSIAQRPTRIRVLTPSELTADMTIVYRGRRLAIVGGPADVENGDAVEVLAVDYSTVAGVQ